ncbi:MAG TPA: hypothetical protein VKY74_03300 [Chloroflexia bacterium]|nr:hypothetical protein [Chloroflexia bacterium]
MTNQGGESARPKALSTTLRDRSLGGLREIDQWMQTHWQLSYDRPELLRVITQIAIEVVELGLVRRQGLHFTFTGLVTPPPLVDLEPAVLADPQRRGRAQDIWVGGSTVVGLAWIQTWMRKAGYTANWSEVLEVVIDLTLQALQAGLVARPIGPYVRVIAPGKTAR